MTTMKLGAYTACLHNYTLPEALKILKDDGLDGAEVNAGGFIPSPHCPVDLLIGSATARDEYLGVFADAGMRLAGLNTSGNPLDPLPDVGPRHAYDLKRTIELAGKLGITDIVCMSGLPGSDADAHYPSWVVNPWNGEYLEVLDYQKSVLDPFWKEMDARAGDAGVKLAWELHPHNTVFTPVGFLEFHDRTGLKNVGVNMDPSHLMWQGMDIVASIKLLGEHIFHVHAKDTKIFPGVATRGVLDPSFGKWPEAEADRYPRRHGALVLDVAFRPGVAFRRDRSGPRRRLVGRLPAGNPRDQPRHEHQHRTRGRRVRPARGHRAGCQDSPRGR